MFTYLISILTAFLNVTGCYCFFEIFGRKQPQSKGKSILFFTILYILFYLVEILPLSFAVVKMSIICVAAAWIMNRQISIKKTALWFVSGWYTSKRLVLELLFLCNEDIFGSCQILNPILADVIRVIVDISIYILWVGGLFLLKKKLGRRAGILFENKDWHLFIPVPIISIFLTLYILYKRIIAATAVSWDVYIAVATGVLVFQAFAFNLYQTLAIKEMRSMELGMRQNSLEQRVNLHQDIYIKAEQQRTRAHDFMTHLLSMKYIVEAKQYDELEKYIVSQMGNIRTDWTAFDTQNIVVNAILNTKYCEARDKGIFVRIDHNKLRGLPIENEDMAVMLANLFNNAIEATEKCVDEKVIRMKIFWENQQLYIYVSNTHMNIIKCNNQIFYTTKTEQPDEHGFGIRNIKAVVEKYNGQSAIRYDESEFVFEIRIPIN